MIKIGENKQISQVQSVGLAQARDYLRRQLLAPNPSVTSIYNQVKSYVDSNAHLSQMMSNQLSLMQSAHGWTLNLVSPTAQDRTRYLVSLELLLAVLA